MNTKSCSRRKVAWVVLGVVVLLAVASMSPLILDLWYEVAYVPVPGLEAEASEIREGYPLGLRNLEMHPPDNAHSAWAYAPRFSWLPGRMLCFFYDENGRVIAREPIEYWFVESR